jgi:hypothetical protein
VILSDLSDFVRSDKFPTVQVKVGQTRQQPYKVVCPVRFPVRVFCLFFFIGEGPEEGGQDAGSSEPPDLWEASN